MLLFVCVRSYSKIFHSSIVGKFYIIETGSYTLFYVNDGNFVNFTSSNNLKNNLNS